jgi:hypothetical protein
MESGARTNRIPFYCRATESEALEGNVLTEEEARQLAIDVAKLSALMRRED